MDKDFKILGLTPGSPEAREKIMGLAVKAYNKAHGISMTGRKNEHPERDIQNAILQWLTLKKIYHFRINNMASTVYSGGRMVRLPVAQRGLPDIAIVVKGRYIACEVKAPNGRQSEEQKAVQEETEKAGGLYWIVRSLEELEANIGTLLKQP